MPDELERYGFIGVTELTGALKGWMFYSSGGRGFLFDPRGLMSLWGIDAKLIIADGKEYAKFLKDLREPCTVRQNQKNWFVTNCRTIFRADEYARIMSYYLSPASMGWDATRFLRTAVPGCKDEPELIAQAVLGLLAAAPVVSKEHFETQLKQFRRWVYSLPENVRAMPATNFNPGLWLDFDKSLDEAGALESNRTRLGTRIPQTLTANQILALVDLLERTLNELPDGQTKKTYEAALNILLGHNGL